MSQTTTPLTDDPPPALATTKRKFHKLLENITRPSKRTHDVSTSFIDPPAKRIRLDPTEPLPPPTPEELRAEARARVEAQIQHRRLHPLRANSARSRKSTTTETTPIKEPSYNPWSHPGFLRRLQTYSNIRLWSSKPDPINEVAWAKRGWVCAELNTVACKGGCEARVVVCLRPQLKDEKGKEIEASEDLSVDASDELVAKIEELVLEGHEDGCLWRGSGCRDDVYRLPIARHGVWEEELKARYAEFDTTESCLPRLSDIQSAVDVSQLAEILPPDFTHNVEPDSTGDTTKEGADQSLAIASTTNTLINKTALTFALHGWTLSEDSTPDYPLAICSACFRRLGLWLFTKPDQSEDIPQSENTNQSEASHTPHLNLSAQHRTYCPWINSTSQHMNGSLSGLSGISVLARCIENAARFREGGLSSHLTSRPDTPATTAADESMNVSGLGRDPAAGESDPQIQTRQSKEEIRAEKQRVKEVQAKEDRERFARLRALTKTLKLRGLGLKLRGKQFN